MTHKFVAAIGFWRVERGAGMAHVLSAMKDSKGETVKEVSRREITGHWAQRKAADFLQEPGHVLQLRNFVGRKIHSFLQHAPILEMSLMRMMREKKNN